MGTQWIWLMFFLVDFLHVVMSMSTCKAVDMDQVKKRRIEAIRGQILSKLRLTEPPEVVSDELPVPKEILSIYNSTVDTIKEKTEKEKTTVEEYYSKQVEKIEMKIDNDGGNTNSQPEENEFFFTFNASRVREIVIKQDLLHQAELRILRQKVSTDHLEVRLELYRVEGNSSSTRYLDSKFVWPGSPDEWLSFDVTDSVKRWLTHTSKNENEMFKLQTPCSCSGSKTEVQLKIGGFTDKRGDLEKIAQGLKPYLLITYTPEGRMAEGHSTRRKRGAEKDQCGDSGKNCCVKSLYINFRKDLGWKWIHEPKGYEANYCLGNCPFIWSMDKQYSKVLALYNQNNPGASISPCCVPEVLDPLPIIYYVGRTAKVEKLSNMVVRSCQCS